MTKKKSDFKDPILVVRKADKTIHQVELHNEPSLRALSNKQKPGHKWEFEYMEREEAAKLPFIDPNYVTAGDAQLKVKDLQAANTSQADRIKELEAQLEASKKGKGAPVKDINNGDEGNKDKGTGDEKPDYSDKKWTVPVLKAELERREIPFGDKDAKPILIGLLEAADDAAGGMLD